MPRKGDVREKDGTNEVWHHGTSWIRKDSAIEPKTWTNLPVDLEVSDDTQADDQSRGRWH